VIDEYLVAVRVKQDRLAPEVRLIHRVARKAKPSSLQFVHGVLDVVDLEVDARPRLRRGMLGTVQRPTVRLGVGSRERRILFGPRAFLYACRQPVGRKREAHLTVVTYLIIATACACGIRIWPALGGYSRSSYGALPATLGVAALVIPALASAAPTTATLSVRGVPVPVNPSAPNSPTYAGTGETLGGGTAVEGELKISGTEYGGFPPPVTHVTFLAPAGAKLHPQGFATCSQATLESHEVSLCPKQSAASPVGSVSGVVSFGSTRVHETLTLQAFFAPGGELAFYAEGRSPAVIEVLGKAGFTDAGGMFGPEFNATVPLVETVPEAPYAVVESVRLKIGAAFMQGKKLISYVTLPKKCPRGGFPVRAELRFLIGEPVTINTRMPCPKR
jgi:hypothetical protein